MDRQNEIALLIEQSRYVDTELKEAMLMGAQALQKKGIPEELKDWLDYPYLDEVNLGC